MPICHLKITDKQLPKWQIKQKQSKPPKTPLCQVFPGEYRANMILSHLTHPIVGFTAHQGGLITVYLLTIN